MEPLVYVIDDDPSVLQALARAVRSAGYAVVGCRSAETFFATYRPDQPGCILLDLEMPQMGGEELHRLLLQRGVRLPVIFMSGGDDMSAAVRAMKRGASDFLSKPIEMEMLIGAIERALELYVAAEHANRNLCGVLDGSIEAGDLVPPGWSSPDKTAPGLLSTMDQEALLELAGRVGALEAALSAILSSTRIDNEVSLRVGASLERMAAVLEAGKDPAAKAFSSGWRLAMQSVLVEPGRTGPDVVPE